MMINDDIERYSRQTILKGFGEPAQQKLGLAKVLVIGAGGLGCPALQYLTAAGIGCIGIADADIVSLSNLHRQTLYTTADIGLFKVAVAAKKLNSINPGVTIITHQFNIDNKNALTIISGYDYVLDGSDNFATRYLVNDACFILNKPLVFGAVAQYQGQLAIFNVADTNGMVTNYRDVFPVPPKKGEVLNCAEAGVMGVLPGIIGTMQAAEIIKLITGIGKPVINNLLTYNLLNNDIYDITIQPSETKHPQPLNEKEFLQMEYNNFCNLTQNQIVEIDAIQFQALRTLPSTLVIDVRELGELPLISTISHLQLPMTVFKEEIVQVKEHTLILFCQHGIRSIYAAEMIQEIFGDTKQVYSLKGGISRWATKLL